MLEETINILAQAAALIYTESMTVTGENKEGCAVRLERHINCGNRAQISLDEARLLIETIDAYEDRRKPDGAN